MSRSSTPFDPVVSKDSLGLLSSPIGENNGESEGVYPLSAHPGWLLKVFKSHLVNDADATRIDQLVELAANSSASDRTLLSSHCSWPVARVTSASRKAYGVVLPIAPPPYWVNIRLDASHTKYKPLEIDWLATAPEKCRRRGIPVPSFADRAQICADLVAVAELLERHNLVYGDWSYANAFWSADKRSGYVIDLDGCAFRTRTSLGTQNWDDPCATSKQRDNLSDRYGVALLLARCLTGERVIESALNSLRQVATKHNAASLYDQVRSGVLATKRGNRPTIATLLTVLRAVEISSQPITNCSDRPPSGVVDWVSITKVRRPTAPRANPTGPSTPKPKPARPNTPKPNPASPGAPKPKPARPSTPKPSATPGSSSGVNSLGISTPWVPSAGSYPPSNPPPAPQQVPDQQGSLGAILLAIGVIVVLILVLVYR
jgi:hypothetical protein